MQDTRPWIERWHPGSNEFAGISGHYNQVFQGSNCRNEQVRLSKGVTTPLTFDHHGFPADNHVLGNGKDAIGEQRPECAVKP